LARCGLPVGSRRECTAIEKFPLTEKERTAAESGLLLYPKNSVLCRLGNSEFDNGLRRNLDLLLRPGIEARACLPLLLHQLAKTGQDKFAVLFNLFVRERAERPEEYSSGSFVGLGGSSECDLKFSLGHVSLLLMAAEWHHFKRIAHGLFVAHRIRRHSPGSYLPEISPGRLAPNRAAAVALE
jgi:hypothetical protein